MPRPQSRSSASGRPGVRRLLGGLGLAALVAGPAIGPVGSFLPSACVPAALAAPAPQSVPKPGGDQFAILQDGRVLVGTTTEDAAAGTISVQGQGTFPKSDVALAYGVKKDKRRRIHRSDDAGTWLAWKAHLDATYAPGRNGKKFAPEEKAAADAYAAACLEAVRQCTEWKAWSAAGALLGDALELGVWNADLQEAALASCPDTDSPECFGFSPADEEKGKLWARWARAIIPLGGRFVNKELHPKKDSTQRHWLTDTIVLRTRNIELWSMEKGETEKGFQDVCDTLRQAEATIRGLEKLLGRPTDGNEEPLMVRLCRNREQYLLDIGPGGRPPDWSGGFFSPGDGISRFYVGFKGEMRETVSHELTHHWLERRMYRGGDRYVGQPGYWIVEGFARFVEHQSHAFQKGVYGFDNDRARSVASCRGALPRGLLFPARKLIDLSQKQFGSEITADDTKLTLFYEQSGAFVFYLMNKRGKDGRDKLVEYMRKYYAGEFWDTGPVDPEGRRKVEIEKGTPVLEGWKVLGFSSAEELDKGFRDFLGAGAQK